MLQPRFQALCTRTDGGKNKREREGLRLQGRGNLLFQRKSSYTSPPEKRKHNSAKSKALDHIYSFLKQNIKSCNAIKTTKATRTVIKKKKTVSLISKKATLHVQHTLFVHFFDVVLHDCNEKLPETSWLHVLYRKCRTCSCSLFCFSTPAHFFHLRGRQHFSFSRHRYKIFMLFFQQKVFPLFFNLFCLSVCIFNIVYGFSYLRTFFV